MANNLKGLLIDYEFCTGCHSCEVACKKHLKLEKGQFGIALAQDGPRKKPDGKWDYNFVPIPTELCDLCEDRVKAGKQPTCVHHCQAFAITYGTVEELCAKIDKTKMALFIPAGQNQ